MKYKLLKPFVTPVQLIKREYDNENKNQTDFVKGNCRCEAWS